MYGILNMSLHHCAYSVAICLWFMLTYRVHTVGLQLYLVNTKARDGAITQICFDRHSFGSIMIDDFENKDARSSGELWSEICSSLPKPQEEGQDGKAEFTDSFQPAPPSNTQLNGASSNPAVPTGPWEPMADSEMYLASLGRSHCLCNTLTSRNGK